MNSTAKLSATTITNLLKKSGYHKSQYHASGRVRGFGTTTEGFTTENEFERRGVNGKYTKYYSGNVIVSYTQKTGTATFSQLAKVIKDAGYKVTKNHYGQLVVSK